MSKDQISINNLSKIFDNGFEALKNINLNIKKGEIFAMLGPNGAGKTTLISIICGIVRLSSGKVTVDDLDIIKIIFCFFKNFHLASTRSTIFNPRTNHHNFSF